MITIDGPAGAGKTTTARKVAEALGYTYIDSGAMYRAVTLAAIRAGVSTVSDELGALCHKLTIELQPSVSGQRTFLNGEDVTEAIRDPKVTSLVSEVSSNQAVRRNLVQRQREMGLHGGIVMDGRDIGSVVFPNAQVKVFLVADIEERTRRRYADLKALGIETTMEALRNQIAERDRKDSERLESPLIQPEGAIVLDTTHLTIEGQVQAILKMVREYQRTANLVEKYLNL